MKHPYKKRTQKKKKDSAVKYTRRETATESQIYSNEPNLAPPPRVQGCVSSRDREREKKKRSEKTNGCTREATAR